MTVVSHLHDEFFSLHWHGLALPGAPWSDGATGLTECGIPPGSSYTYMVPTGDQVGTYYYHSHAGALRSGGGPVGALIIDDPQPPWTVDPSAWSLGSSNPTLYDEERTLEIIDWCAPPPCTRTLTATKMSADVLSVTWHPDPNWPHLRSHFERWSCLVTPRYHRGPNEQAVGLDSVKFEWIGDPYSILHNGKGAVDCETVDAYLSCKENGTFAEVSVTEGKTYRLRLINEASLSYLNFRIEQHTLTVIEVDGTYVTPYEVSGIDINAGQRISVLLTANQSPDAYWINSQTRWRSKRSGQAILRYDSIGSAIFPSATRLSTVEAAAALPTSTWGSDGALMQIASNISMDEHRKVTPTVQENKDHPVPLTATRTYTLDTSQERMSYDGTVSFTPYDKSTQMYDKSNPEADNNYLRWPTNGKATLAQSTPVLHSVYKNILGTKAAPEPNRVFYIESGDVIDVVLQNNLALNGKADQHPWHMHGHSFWVLGYGLGQYDPKTAVLNTVNPLRRDTVRAFGGSHLCPSSHLWCSCIADWFLRA